MNIFHRTIHTHIQDRSFRRFFRHIGRDPFFDWPVVCGVTMTMVFLLVMVGFITYRNIHEQLDKEAFVPVQATIFDPNGLDILLERFDARDSERKGFLGGYQGQADPSL